MKKLEFLMALHSRLAGLPEADREERVSFYCEMIEDRVEEGMPEEEAVAAVGNVEEIAAQILEDTPLLTLTKEKIRPKKRFRVWESVLLVLGSPVWLSLLIALVAVLFSLYISFWALLIALWAVFAAVACCVLGCAAAGVVLLVTGRGTAGLAAFGLAFVSLGLSVLLFIACKAASAGTVRLTAAAGRRYKRGFMKREEV